MVTVTNQGVKMGFEVMEDEEDPVVVVQVQVADEEMEEEATILAVKAVMVANMHLKPRLRLLLLQHNIIRTKISKEILNNNIISIKLVKIPIGLGMPMIKRQQVKQVRVLLEFVQYSIVFNAQTQYNDYDVFIYRFLGYSAVMHSLHKFLLSIM
jgi:hypothetical protein